MLTKEQDAALMAVNKWLADDSKWFFTLKGYAGTGKTFTMQHFINNLPTSEPVICCTPTGKAASVLARKLKNQIVITIHKLLYTPFMPCSVYLEELLELALKNPDDKNIMKEIDKEKKRLAKVKISFSIKDDFDIRPGQLIVVDEASMVTKKMFEDFEKTNCKVLFVGDHGQLPAIGDSEWFVYGKSDAVLTEIQRQALDSPIIRMSMEIRNNSIRKSEYSTDDCKFAKRDQTSIEEFAKADQIITGSNFNRQRINRELRKYFGYFGEMPARNEKIICLKNQNAGNFRFINGIQAITTSVAEYSPDDGHCYLDMEYDDLPIKDVKIYDYFFRRHYDKTIEEEPWFNRQDLREFDYAYAITCHKAQGSEWDYVIVDDDRIRSQDMEFRRRWLYTAVTRAKKKLLWVQA